MSLATEEQPEPTPPSAASASAFGALPWVRPVAVLTVVAALLGRAIAPSFHGLATGLDGASRVLDFAGAFLSQVAFIGLAFLVVRETLSVLQVGRLPLAFRLAATSLAGLLLGLTLPASVTRVPFYLAVILTLGAVALALASAAQALVSKHTRAVAVVLALYAVAALTREVAWGMALYGGEAALARVATAARGVATAAIALSTAANVVAMVWLATRKKQLFSPWTTGSLGLAMIASWYTEHPERALDSPVKLLIARASLRLVAPPAAYGPASLAVFLAVCALLFAIVALVQRNQIAGVVGALSLALVGGMQADVPLCALATGAAGLAIALAAHDERGVWAALPPKPNAGD